MEEHAQRALEWSLTPIAFDEVGLELWRRGGSEADDAGADHTSAAYDNTGLDLWPIANKALYGYLKRLELPFWAGKHVLELGAGTGLLGLLIAKARPGVGSITLTDSDPLAQELCQRNVEHNSCSGVCAVAPLDWRSCEERRESCDVCLACEVLYVSSQARMLARAVATVLNADGVCLIGHELRFAIFRDAQGVIRHETEDEALQAFLDECGKVQLHAQLLCGSQELSASDSHIQIYGVARNLRLLEDLPRSSTQFTA